MTATIRCDRCQTFHPPADQLPHGPETCEGCGVYHTGWWDHMDEHGCPLPPDASEPMLRMVVFAGFDNDGRTLYTDADEDAP